MSELFRQSQAINMCKELPLRKRNINLSSLLLLQFHIMFDSRGHTPISLFWLWMQVQAPWSAGGNVCSERPLVYVLAAFTRVPVGLLGYSRTSAAKTIICAGNCAPSLCWDGLYIHLSWYHWLGLPGKPPTCGLCLQLLGHPPCSEWFGGRRAAARSACIWCFPSWIPLQLWGRQVWHTWGHCLRLAGAVF